MTLITRRNKFIIIVQGQMKDLLEKFDRPSWVILYCIHCCVLPFESWFFDLCESHAGLPSHLKKVVHMMMYCGAKIKTFNFIYH